ncbi:MAG: homoserine O-succinyltransferase [Clostridia bacterium]|nr:homoserine O-succinyltransferase [Clostridia bacterium]
MPVKIPNTLPAAEMLTRENIFVMSNERAEHQDIRPLRVGIINLMPTKETTETQILRLLSNSPLQVDVFFIRTGTYLGKNTKKSHLDEFYITIDEVIASGARFDALIVTGAPVEKLAFEDVKYWDELTRIMDWADKNVYSTMFICWAALAGLKWHYGIEKRMLEDKCVGVFEHRVTDVHHPLVRGFDENFLAPHSRYGTVLKEDIVKQEDLVILAESEEAGLHLIVSRDGRRVYVTGHGEYDRDTLKKEYERDIAQGITDSFPKHYFPHDDPKSEPALRWRSHASLLYANWLNYLVYQNTPYNLLNLSCAR